MNSLSRAEVEDTLERRRRGLPYDESIIDRALEYVCLSIGNEDEHEYYNDDEGE